MAKAPEEILRAFQEQKMAISGLGPRLPDMAKMLQTITSELPTFICMCRCATITLPQNLSRKNCPFIPKGAGTLGKGYG